MKSIALLEMASHNEVLRSYVVALLAANCELVCCTTRINYKQLYDLQGDSRVKWLLKDKAATAIRNVKAPFFIDLSPQRVVCCEHKFYRTLYLKLILSCKCGLFKKKISIKLFFLFPAITPENVFLFFYMSI